MTNKYDKLVTSLNEYREKEHGYNVPEWEEKELSLPDWYIISKELGFIKWLVDNDKIDKSKYERILDRIEYYSQSEEEQERHYYSDYESLLMLLAISSSPIDDLISYLK